MKVALHNTHGSDKSRTLLDSGIQQAILQNSTTRRHIALALIAIGGVLFMIAPENSMVSLALAGLGVLSEIMGIRLGHTEQP